MPTTGIRPVGNSLAAASAMPIPTHLPIWVNDDAKEGAVYVPSALVPPLVTYAESQLPVTLGKAQTQRFSEQI